MLGTDSHLALVIRVRFHEPDQVPGAKAREGDRFAPMPVLQARRAGILAPG
jgi:hypothetical protein